MKHIQVLQEIQEKVQEMCHEFLKVSGIYGVSAINQLAGALTSIQSYVEPKPQANPTPTAVPPPSAPSEDDNA